MRWYYYLIDILYSRSVNCPIIFLIAVGFHSGSIPRYHVTVGCHVSLVFFILKQLLSLSLCFLTLIFLEGTGQFFGSLSLSLYFWCFLNIRFRWWLFGRNTQWWSCVLLGASHQETHVPVYSTIGDVSLNTELRCCLWGFPTIQFPLCS